MNRNEIVGAGKDALGTVKDVAGGLVGDAGMKADGALDQVAGQVQGAVGRVAGSVQEGAEAVASRASAWSESAGDAASALAGRAGEAGTKAARYVNDAVKQQPLLSLIGIAAIGYVAAYLVHSSTSPFAPQPVRRFMR